MYVTGMDTQDSPVLKSSETYLSFNCLPVLQYKEFQPKNGTHNPLKNIHHTYHFGFLLECSSGMFIMAG